VSAVKGLDYGLDSWKLMVQFVAVNEVSPPRNPEKSGEHTFSSAFGTRVSFAEINRPDPESDHSPQSSAEVKNE
jgi:hypothetical protein